MSNWKEIWNRRNSDEGVIDLDTLIKLDGYDTGAGRIDATNWRRHAASIANRLGINNGATVYEVGCGSGAFLYALRELFPIKVGGIDYSAGLIATASQAMPDGHFTEGGAATLDIVPQYDFVISNGVFHYFSLEYASEVLERMMKKSKISVGIMDIPDVATKDEAEALRRGILGPEEYNEKYKGLEHTYYARSWFEEQAKEHGFTCKIFDGCVPNYAQNSFRFGIIIHK